MRIQAKIIAHEPLNAIAGSEWAYSARARKLLRILIKRILRKQGYPPDLKIPPFVAHSRTQMQFGPTMVNRSPGMAGCWRLQCRA